MEWYYLKNGNKVGPISTAELKQLAARGELQNNDRIWREGLKNWIPAANAKGLFPSSTPPAVTDEYELASPAHSTSKSTVSEHKADEYELAPQKNAHSPPALTDVKIPPLELKSESVGVAPVGSTCPCPFCAEPIAQAAIKCKHCGEFLVANGNSGGIQSGPRTDTANSAPGQAHNLSLIQALATMGCLITGVGLTSIPLLSLVGFIWAAGLLSYISSAKITNGRIMTIISLILSGLGLIYWNLPRN